MSNPDFHRRLALVTGATGGIGRATCQVLASLGCSIAVHFNSSTAKAESLVAKLREKGVSAEAFQADLREYDGVRSLHARVHERMGPPAILFNNAGITMDTGVQSISDVSIETFEKTWRANCGSAFLLTQLCLPEMEKAGWGRIIFCSSVASFNGGVVGPHYACVAMFLSILTIGLLGTDHQSLLYMVLSIGCPSGMVRKASLSTVLLLL